LNDKIISGVVILLLTETQLLVTLPSVKASTELYAKSLSDSVYQPVAEKVAAWNVRTDLQTDVFSDANWQTPT